MKDDAHVSERSIFSGRDRGRECLDGGRLYGEHHTPMNR